MPDLIEAIESAISELRRLRARIGKIGTVQVRNSEDKAVIKATAYAWFRNHRPVLLTGTAEDSLTALDTKYSFLADATERGTSKQTYIDALKVMIGMVVALRPTLLAVRPKTATPDDPPDFALLVSDRAMQAILERRWAECVACIEGSAPMAATVMMGGLLEALLLARILREEDKDPMFKASTAPKDKGKTLQLKEWGLRNFIDVAHELGWISQGAKDVGDVLRDYRNYIHPQKEHSHGIRLTTDDARIFWKVGKSISRQVIR